MTHLGFELTDVKLVRYLVGNPTILKFAVMGQELPPLCEQPQVAITFLLVGCAMDIYSCYVFFRALMADHL